MIIEYLNTHQDKFMPLWTNSLKELIKNQKSVGNDGKIIKTNEHSWDYTYFYMIDKMGHTTIYRAKCTGFIES